MKHSEVLKIYLNSGNQIPEKQFDRLSSSLKYSYLRKRGVSGYEDWEFKTLSDDEKINYIETKDKKLYYHDMKYFLGYSKNKDDIATKIIERIGEKLHYHIIYYLLKYSDNKDDIIATKIININGEELNKDDIECLLKLSKNKDDIATKIIETKGEKLEYGDIQYLLDYLDNKELIKKTLLQNGVDYKLINDTITRNRIKTQLIPYNYQSMLQEIKRIKQIML